MLVADKDFASKQASTSRSPSRCSRRRDRYIAFADTCIHQERSLFKGTLLNGKVICPGHQWHSTWRADTRRSRTAANPPTRCGWRRTPSHQPRPPPPEDVRCPRPPEREPGMTSPTFVTVGAGQTAAVAARTLRRRGFDGRIVLVGDEPYAPYQRPPLSKEFLAGRDTFESLLLLPEAWLARQRRRDRHRNRGDPRRSATRTVGTRGRTPDSRRRRTVRHRRPPADTAGAGPRPDLVHYCAPSTTRDGFSGR